MTLDQQKSITAFVERAVANSQPPLDVEADAIIRALLVRNPEAAYRITMLAMAQEQILNRDLNGGLDKLTQDEAAQQKSWLARFFPKPNLRQVRREPVVTSTLQA